MVLCMRAQKLCHEKHLKEKKSSFLKFQKQSRIFLKKTNVIPLEGPRSIFKKNSFQTRQFNKVLRKFLEKLLKFQKKKYKDGLKSGIRIITMNKYELKTNPLPSYIFIDGFELYST